jgi:hypothetical protein
MSNDNGHTFKTTSGFCHVLPEAILFTRDGIVENVAELADPDNLRTILVIYAGFSIGLFCFAVDSFLNGAPVNAVLAIVFGIYLCYVINCSRNNSSASIISRGKVKKVKFRKAFSILHRTRFDVFFADSDGRTKRRRIILPGTFRKDHTEISRAIGIMTENGLMA